MCACVPLLQELAETKHHLYAAGCLDCLLPSLELRGGSLWPLLWNRLCCCCRYATCYCWQLIMSSWMTVPCWSQWEETEINAERQEVRERHGYSQRYQWGISLSGSVEPERDYAYIHIGSKYRHMCCVVSSFFCHFLSLHSLAFSCLSVSGGRWQQEEEEDRFHCVSAEPI